MNHNEYRRSFLQKLGVLSIGLGTTNFAMSKNLIDIPETSLIPTKVPDLKSLSSSQVFTVLDMDLPGLKKAKQSLEAAAHDEALREMLTYYRRRYPEKNNRSDLDRSQVLERADQITQHIFQWGPYPPANYGPDIDWAADPASDIEWVASIHRFSWTNDLKSAYELTKDEKYAKAFVDLTTDWIEKHPLEKTIDAMHPVYGPGVYGSRGWKGYAWLDLQTGIRATNICKSFRTFLHATSFTPDFLGVLLASMYDHQVKTEYMPMNMVHNKAIFEQRGFFNVLHTFREYLNRERWIELGISITCENLIAQTSSDGVQREWCGGYHTGVYRDALEIQSRVKDLGYEMPEYYQHRVKLMADHVFGISTPDLGFPMFGDTKREKKTSDDRKTWPLYSFLVQAGKDFNDSKFQALADLDIKQLPQNGSIAYQDAGLYAMRSNWKPDQVYMAVHCSPPGISSHDTPDNGTFELYAYGKWLMPDSGYFTYGNNKEARNWHRQTKVHATLTCNGENTELAGRQMVWKSEDDQDLLCVENQSYKRFVHRRTIYFVGKNSDMPFYVIYDEAIGDIKGDIALHFPMAPGPVKTDSRSGRIETQFDDVNLLIKVIGKSKLELTEEDGWHAWSYGKREKRTSVSAVHHGQGPLAFTSILVPYRGKIAPEAHLLTDTSQIIAGLDPVNLDVEVDGKKYSLQRKIYSL